ncbi:MAG: hypothetical protein ACXAC5_02465 [Promethearchaeota archaeon]
MAIIVSEALHQVVLLHRLPRLLSSLIHQPSAAMDLRQIHYHEKIQQAGENSHHWYHVGAILLAHALSISATTNPKYLEQNL